MIKFIILIYLTIGALTLLCSSKLVDEWYWDWTLYTLLAWPALWVIAIIGYICGYIKGIKEVVDEALKKQRETE